MSAAILAMPLRQQPRAQQARIEQVERAPESLTLPQLAMYRQALQSLQHLATLARQVQRAEQSHERTDLTRAMEFIRSQAALAVEIVYRLMASMPDSVLEHVREEQAALLAECAEALGLNRAAKVG